MCCPRYFLLPFLVPCAKTRRETRLQNDVIGEILGYKAIEDHLKL